MNLDSLYVKGSTIAILKKQNMCYNVPRI